MKRSYLCIAALVVSTMLLRVADASQPVTFPTSTVTPSNDGTTYTMTGCADVSFGCTMGCTTGKAHAVMKTPWSKSLCSLVTPTADIPVLLDSHGVGQVCLTMACTTLTGSVDSNGYRSHGLVSAVGELELSVELTTVAAQITQTLTGVHTAPLVELPYNARISPFSKDLGNGKISAALAAPVTSPLYGVQYTLEASVFMGLQHSQLIISLTSYTALGQSSSGRRSASQSDRLHLTVEASPTWTASEKLIFVSSLINLETCVTQWLPSAAPPFAPSFHQSRPISCSLGEHCAALMDPSKFINGSHIIIMPCAQSPGAPNPKPVVESLPAGLGDGAMTCVNGGTCMSPGADCEDYDGKLLTQTSSASDDTLFYAATSGSQIYTIDAETLAYKTMTTPFNRKSMSGLYQSQIMNCQDSLWPSIIRNTDTTGHPLASFMCRDRFGMAIAARTTTENKVGQHISIANTAAETHAIGHHCNHRIYDTAIDADNNAKRCCSVVGTAASYDSLLSTQNHDAVTQFNDEAHCQNHPIVSSDFVDFTLSFPDAPCSTKYVPIMRMLAMNGQKEMDLVNDDEAANQYTILHAQSPDAMTVTVKCAAAAMDRAYVTTMSEESASDTSLLYEHKDGKNACLRIHENLRRGPPVRCVKNGAADAGKCYARILHPDHQQHSWEAQKRMQWVTGSNFFEPHHGCSNNCGEYLKDEHLESISAVDGLSAPDQTTGEWTLTYLDSSGTSTKDALEYGTSGKAALVCPHAAAQATSPEVDACLVHEMQTFLNTAQTFTALHTRPGANAHLNNFYAQTEANRLSGMHSMYEIFLKTEGGRCAADKLLRPGNALFDVVAQVNRGAWSSSHPHDTVYKVSNTMRMTIRTTEQHVQGASATMASLFGISTVGTNHVNTVVTSPWAEPLFAVAQASTFPSSVMRSVFMICSDKIPSWRASNPTGGYDGYDVTMPMYLTEHATTTAWSDNIADHKADGTYVDSFPWMTQVVTKYGMPNLLRENYCYFAPNQNAEQEGIFMESYVKSPMSLMGMTQGAGAKNTQGRGNLAGTTFFDMTAYMFPYDPRTCVTYDHKSLTTPYLFSNPISAADFAENLPTIGHSASKCHLEDTVYDPELSLTFAMGKAPNSPSWMYLYVRICDVTQHPDGAATNKKGFANQLVIRAGADAKFTPGLDRDTHADVAGKPITNDRAVRKHNSTHSCLFVIPNQQVSNALMMLPKADAMEMVLDKRVSSNIDAASFEAARTDTFLRNTALHAALNFQGHADVEIMARMADCDDPLREAYDAVNRNEEQACRYYDTDVITKSWEVYPVSDKKQTVTSPVPQTLNAAQPAFTLPVFRDATPQRLPYNENNGLCKKLAAAPGAADAAAAPCAGTCPGGSGTASPLYVEAAADTNDDQPCEVVPVAGSSIPSCAAQYHCVPNNFVQHTYKWESSTFSVARDDSDVLHHAQFSTTMYNHMFSLNTMISSDPTGIVYNSHGFAVMQDAYGSDRGHQFPSYVNFKDFVLPYGEKFHMTMTATMREDTSPKADVCIAGNGKAVYATTTSPEFTKDITQETAFVATFAQSHPILDPTRWTNEGKMDWHTLDCAMNNSVVSGCTAGSHDIWIQENNPAFSSTIANGQLSDQIVPAYEPDRKIHVSKFSGLFPGTDIARQSIDPARLSVIKVSAKYPTLWPVKFKVELQCESEDGRADRRHDDCTQQRLHDAYHLKTNTGTILNWNQDYDQNPAQSDAAVGSYQQSHIDYLTDDLQTFYESPSLSFESSDPFGVVKPLRFALKNVEIVTVQGQYKQRIRNPTVVVTMTFENFYLEPGKASSRTTATAKSYLHFLPARNYQLLGLTFQGHVRQFKNPNSPTLSSSNAVANAIDLRIAEFGPTGIHSYKHTWRLVGKYLQPSVTQKINNLLDDGQHWAAILFSACNPKAGAGTGTNALTCVSTIEDAVQDKGVLMHNTAPVEGPAFQEKTKASGDAYLLQPCPDQTATGIIACNSAQNYTDNRVHDVLGSSVQAFMKGTMVQGALQSISDGGYEGRYFVVPLSALPHLWMLATESTTIAVQIVNRDDANMFGIAAQIDSDNNKASLFADGLVSPFATATAFGYAEFNVKTRPTTQRAYVQENDADASATFADAYSTGGLEASLCVNNASSYLHSFAHLSVVASCVNLPSGCRKCFGQSDFADCPSESWNPTYNPAIDNSYSLDFRQHVKTVSSQDSNAAYRAKSPDSTADCVPNSLFQGSCDNCQGQTATSVLASKCPTIDEDASLSLKLLASNFVFSSTEAKTQSAGRCSDVLFNPNEHVGGGERCQTVKYRVDTPYADPATGPLFQMDFMMAWVASKADDLPVSHAHGQQTVTISQENADSSYPTVSMMNPLSQTAEYNECANSIGMTQNVNSTCHSALNYSLPASTIEMSATAFDVYMVFEIEISGLGEAPYALQTSEGVKVACHEQSPAEFRPQQGAQSHDNKVNITFDVCQKSTVGMGTSSKDTYRFWSLAKTGQSTTPVKLELFVALESVDVELALTYTAKTSIKTIESKLTWELLREIGSSDECYDYAELASVPGTFHCNVEGQECLSDDTAKMVAVQQIDVTLDLQPCSKYPKVHEMRLTNAVQHKDVNLHPQGPDNEYAAGTTFTDSLHPMEMETQGALTVGFSVQVDAAISNYNGWVLVATYIGNENNQLPYADVARCGLSSATGEVPGRTMYGTDLYQENSPPYVVESVVPEEGTVVPNNEFSTTFTKDNGKDYVAIYTKVWVTAGTENLHMTLSCAKKDAFSEVDFQHIHLYTRLIVSGADNDAVCYQREVEAPEATPPTVQPMYIVWTDKESQLVSKSLTEASTTAQHALTVKLGPHQTDTADLLICGDAEFDYFDMAEDSTVYQGATLCVGDQAASDETDTAAYGVTSAYVSQRSSSQNNHCTAFPARDDIVAAMNSDGRPSNALGATHSTVDNVSDCASDGNPMNDELVCVKSRKFATPGDASTALQRIKMRMCMRLKLGEFASWKNWDGSVAGSSTLQSQQSKVTFRVSLVAWSATKLVGEWSLSRAYTHTHHFQILDAAFKHLTTINDPLGSVYAEESSSVVSMHVQKILAGKGRAVCEADKQKARDATCDHDGQNCDANAGWANVRDCPADADHYRVVAVLEYCVPRAGKSHMLAWTPKASKVVTDDASISRTEDKSPGFLPYTKWNAAANKFDQNCLGFGMADATHMKDEEGIHDKFSTVLKFKDGDVVAMCHRSVVHSAALHDVANEVSALEYCENQNTILATKAWRVPTSPHPRIESFAYAATPSVTTHMYDLTQPQAAYEAYVAPVDQSNVHMSMAKSFTVPAQQVAIAQASTMLDNTVLQHVYSLDVVHRVQNGVMHLHNVAEYGTRIVQPGEPASVVMQLHEDSQTCGSNSVCNNDAGAKQCSGNDECWSAGRGHDHLYCFALKDATARVSKLPCQIFADSADADVPLCSEAMKDANGKNDDTSYSPWSYEPNWQSIGTLTCGDSAELKTMIDDYDANPSKMAFQRIIATFFSCMKSEWNNADDHVIRSIPLQSKHILVANFRSNPNVVANNQGRLLGVKESRCSTDANCDLDKIPFERSERLKYCKYDVVTKRDNHPIDSSARQPNFAIDGLDQFNLGLLIDNGKSSLVRMDFGMEILYRSDYTQLSGNRRLLSLPISTPEVMPLEDGSVNGRRLLSTDVAFHQQTAHTEIMQLLDQTLQNADVRFTHNSSEYLLENVSPDFIVPGRCWRKIPSEGPGLCDHWGSENWAYPDVGLARFIFAATILGFDLLWLAAQYMLCMRR